MITSIKLTFCKMEKSFMNKPSAQEWLTKAWHHLSSAQLLYKADHYTDIIGVELHYALDISLKSLLAYENSPIKRTHELYEIYDLVKSKITFDEQEVKLLLIATQYHILEAYPSPHRKLPEKQQIQEVLVFTQSMFKDICHTLDIDTTKLH